MEVNHHSSFSVISILKTSRLIIRRPREPILEEVYGCLNLYEDQHLIGLERWFKDNKRTVYLHLLNDQFTFNIMGKIVSLK